MENEAKVVNEIVINEKKPKLLPSLFKRIKYSRKVKITDIKQYLVDEFKLTKELDKENKQLYKKIENFELDAQKHELTLITLNEYKKRITEKNKEIEDLKQEKKNIKEKYSNAINERNDALIETKKYKNELIQKNNSIKKDLETNKNEIKKNIIELIKIQKGNISKEKIIGLINNI